MSEEKGQQTEQGKILWDAGEHYEKQMQLIKGIAEPTHRLIEEAGIRKGFQVLDLAAGTGEQSIPAARAVGSTGTVLATDASSDMLKRAALFAEREGLTNITTRVMNAEQLPLADQTFDAVISRFGLDYINYQKALEEGLRVLRPGRRMAAMIWSIPERHPIISVPITIIQKYIPDLSFPHEISNPGVFEQAFKQAGFSQVSVQPIPIHLQFPSLDTYVEIFLSPPAHMSVILAQLSQEDRQRAIEEIRQALQSFQRPDGTLVFPSEALLGGGTRKE